MLPYTADDVVTVLGSAKNLNSALKNFLKREVKKGDDAARFVKDLRSLLVDKDGRDAEKVLAKYLPQYENHLFVIAGYAHSELVNGTAAQVVESYADDFNKTYSLSDDKFTLLDPKGFEDIAKKALSVIAESLKLAGMEAQPLMKNVLLVSIFERKVLAEVLKHV